MNRFDAKTLINQLLFQGDLQLSVVVKACLPSKQSLAKLKEIIPSNKRLATKESKRFEGIIF